MLQDRFADGFSLRAFYEVAKIGRFSEAAVRLNISQSALSRSVALLEESEGVHPQIEYQILIPDNPMVLVCQPELWRKNRSSSDLKTLKKVLEKTGYIGSRGLTKNSRSLRVLEELFGSAPKMSMETNNQETQKRFCLAGGGIAYLAKFMVESEIAQGKLIEISEMKAHTFHLWIARRKDRKLTLQAQTFLEELKNK